MTKQETLEQEVKDLKDKVEKLEKMLTEPEEFYELLTEMSKMAHYHSLEIRNIYRNMDTVRRETKSRP